MFNEDPIVTDPPTSVHIHIDNAVALGVNKTYTIEIDDLGKSFLYGKTYTFDGYRHNSEMGAVDLPWLRFEVPGKKLYVDLHPSRVNKYTLKCEIKSNVAKDTTLPIKFTADKVVLSPNVVIPAGGSKSQTVEIDISTAEAEGKFIVGTTYDITCQDYFPIPLTFIPDDHSTLDGYSKLTKAGDKENGAKDEVTVTLFNIHLPEPEDLPEGFTQKLTLNDTTPETGTGVHILDQSKKFKWRHGQGSVAVDFKFNDCPIKKNSNVTATLKITDELVFTDQPIEYEAGVKSVCSVVAALFAVLALVF
ncbi:hypothetical protein BLNAU_6068 [Blattamonas nauphoetae]|uniref:Uncharacterized protein n=1 Tax=Blattamonas nauphoetae TaxID=2049346 RepID=A0ABQ9Y5N2_9EUKA|nr:hypothetical protein BLNAU_6068 [Blattamonas nauphoetae]